MEKSGENKLTRILTFEEVTLFCRCIRVLYVKLERLAPIRRACLLSDFQKEVIALL